jgi:hypothetical protein
MIMHRTNRENLLARYKKILSQNILTSKIKIKEDNYLVGVQWYEFGNKGFAPPVISGSSPAVANMIATRGLHGR